MLSPVIYPRLDAAGQRALLDRVIARCAPKKGEPSPVVVFDLDGTLLDNRPRTVRILHELGQAWQARDREIGDKLLAATADKLAYLLSDSLAKLGVTRTDVIADAEVYWRERFFVDDYLKHDVEVAGAGQFARACYEAGAVLVYFTGRDLPLMGVGSFASLRDLGFPIAVPGTELVCKPDANMPDEAFKRLVGPEIARVGRVVAVFDNEPGNCNVLFGHFPESESVMVDTQHLPGAPALVSGVHVIGDFVR